MKLEFFSDECSDKTRNSDNIIFLQKVLNIREKKNVIFSNKFENVLFIRIYVYRLKMFFSGNIFANVLIN